MFEEMVVSNVKNKKTNKPWTVGLSMLLQVGFLAILILIPLIYTEALPKTMMADVFDPVSATTASTTSSASASRSRRQDQAGGPSDGGGKAGCSEGYSERRQDH